MTVDDSEPPLVLCAEHVDIFIDQHAADRLVEACTPDFGFCPEVGWLDRTGRHLRVNNGAVPEIAKRFARQDVLVARSAFATAQALEAQAKANTAARKAVLDRAQAAASPTSIAKTVEQAKADPRVVIPLSEVLAGLPERQVVRLLADLAAVELAAQR